MASEMEFVNPDLIWTPEQLKARLGDETLAIVDVRTTREVMTGIIPGASHLDIYGISLTKTTPERMDEFIALLRGMIGLRGVAMDKTVCIYEHDQTGMKAGRLFWLLEYMGHRDVHVLDGGIKAWQDAGFDTTREMKAIKPGRMPIELQEQAFVSADELHGLLGQDDLVLLDTRNDDEWLGTNTRGGPRGGTIPGAVHLVWTKFLADSGKLKSPAELTALLESQGVMRDKRIVPF